MTTQETVETWQQTDPLLTKQQASDYLTMSPRTIDKLINTRQLAVVHIGRSVRIRKSQLDAYLAANTSPAAGGAR